MRTCRLTIYRGRVQKEDAAAILYDTVVLSDAFNPGPDCAGPSTYTERR